MNIVTDESVDGWPAKEYLFKALFRKLTEDVLKQKREFCEDIAETNKFSLQPDSYHWNQLECLHYLVSQVGSHVEHERSPLKKERFRLW